MVAGTGQAVRIHDAETGAALSGTVRAVAFVRGGYWAIHPDGSVHLHDNTGTAVGDLDLHRAAKARLQVAGLRLLRPDDLPEDPDD